MKRLSDEEWEDVQDTAATYDSDSSWRKLVEDHRDLRALLATPWTNDAQRAPHAYDKRDHRVSFYLHRADHIVTADHALQLGAALIRAALAAKEGAK